ncbi:MAG: Holliday junction DNA helicase RuvB C-terminal domain-containing protein, partial [Bacilli bacterium]|nr:Holliday junction DNA helicase RuvB C-terminal domain-containing protein [Bacilli bacterium]
DKGITLTSLDKLAIDKSGLDQVDNEYLNALIYKFNGGPAGIECIAATIGEEVTTIKDVVEPFLLQEGFIKRTNRGRVVTDKTYKYFKIDNEKSLF